jgi:hypothetical protein
VTPAAPAKDTLATALFAATKDDATVTGAERKAFKSEFESRAPPASARHPAADAS